MNYGSSGKDLRRRQKRPHYFDPDLPVFARRDSAQYLRRQRAASRSLSPKRPSLRPIFFKTLAVLLLGVFLGWLFKHIGSMPVFFDNAPSPLVERFEPSLSKPSLPPLEMRNGPRLTHKLRRGENLSLIASRKGLPHGDLQAIDKTFQEFSKTQEHPTVLKAGQTISLVLGGNGQVDRFELPLSAGESLVIERGQASENFQARVRSLPKVQKERTLIGVIESSFAAAARQAGVPYDVVDDLVDLVGSKISFYRDFQKGDRFVVIYKEKVLEDGTSVAPGPILAAALHAGSKRLTAVRYVGTDGKARYFDSQGKLIENSFLRYPLRFSRISSHYTDSRLHPILKRRRPHHGVDFAAPRGTAVRTVADGTVVSAGRNGAAGKMIKIKHSDRYSTVYMHLSKISVRRGKRVARGQVIGAVGSTGLSTGPHLDFRFIDRGRYVNPLTIKLPILEKLTEGNTIDKQYLKRVLFTLQHYQNLKLEDSYWRQ